jgi:hypothetical protein
MHTTRTPALARGWKVLAAVAVVFGLLGSAGCATLNPMRLEDTVVAFHDDLRWGRTDAAERTVVAAIRGDFTARHSHWSSRVRIADLEMDPPRTREGRTYVRARYVWIFVDEIEQRETVVETRWSAGLNDWTCDEERVVSGDPRLLALPGRPAVAPGTRAGSAAAARGAL